MRIAALPPRASIEAIKRTEVASALARAACRLRGRSEAPRGTLTIRSGARGETQAGCTSAAWHGEASEWRGMRNPDATSAEDEFPAIGDYALIGDCGSTALVSRNGAVEWLCLPRFDSPSLFAAILDRERGGSFRIAPTLPYRSVRRYVDGTAVLETEFHTATGVLRLRDCMVAVPGVADGGASWPEHQLLREIRCLDGRVDTEVMCDARFDYGRRRVRMEPRGALGIFLQHRGDVIVVRGEIPLAVRDGRIYGRSELEAGERRFVLLAYDYGEPATIPPLGDHAARNLEATLAYWREWSNRCDYEGPYREYVVRSAITLKLMTSSASGAVIAAPTTSLPEQIGGVRNWDYRYCWLRDACFTLRALFELGYVEEGSAFFSWLLHASYHSHATLRVLYNIFGGPAQREVELDHLGGYRGSRPVRRGNAAKDQLQLDLYGALVASAYEYVRRGGSLGSWSGRLLAQVGEQVCVLWRRPDRGIWEIRGPDRRHVHSVAMCWVALDRLLEMARAGDLRLSDRRKERFRRACDAIRSAVDAHGWCARRDSFVSVFDGEEVDASLLLLALYGYVDPADRRMRQTYERVHSELGVAGLLRRYTPEVQDGLPPGEGAFGICSFWAVEYLARAGRVEEAEAGFEKLCEYASDLGLFAEEIDPASGAALGNYPQAFTHVGLVGAALAISEARGARPATELGGRERLACPGRMPGKHHAEDLRTEEKH
jgi:GH15 family glucan-1,4-alpha-glucosidase